jgi:hypothetical protein
VNELVSELEAGLDSGLNACDWVNSVTEESCLTRIQFRIVLIVLILIIIHIIMMIMTMNIFISIMIPLQSRTQEHKTTGLLACREEQNYPRNIVFNLNIVAQGKQSTRNSGLLTLMKSFSD